MSKKKIVPNVVSQDEARAILGSGKMVNVDFLKADNSFRSLTGRAKVSKGVKGVGMAYNPAEKGIVVLYELNKTEPDPAKRYRAIRMERIIKFRAAKKDYVIKK